MQIGPTTACYAQVYKGYTHAFEHSCGVCRSKVCFKRLVLHTYFVFVAPRCIVLTHSQCRRRRRQRNVRSKGFLAAAAEGRVRECDLSALAAVAHMCAVSGSVWIINQHYNSRPSSCQFIGEDTRIHPSHCIRLDVLTFCIHLFIMCQKYT